MMAFFMTRTLKFVVPITLVAICLPVVVDADDQDVIDYREHIMKTLDEQSAAVGMILSAAIPGVDFNNLCHKFQQLMSQPDRCPATTYAKTRRSRTPRDRQGANTADDLPATHGRRQATSISALLVDLAARVLSFGPVHPHGAAP
jgi:hypothetical protein